jgi:lysophospholipase L1-like esterase
MQYLFNYPMKTAAALPAIVFLLAQLAAGQAPPTTSATVPAAADDKVPLAVKVENGIAWRDPVSWGVEGRGWTSGLARYYDRLPARAQTTVPGGVWYFSHESAGMSVRFVTDAGSIHVRYRLSSPDLSHGWADNANMSASGIDLYAQSPAAASGKPVWRWVGGNKPTAQSGSDCLVNGLAPGRRPYQLNLPAYNGIESIEIGVPEGASFEPLAPRPDLPIVFYGTSIMQGGVASRPGLSIPAIVGRRLDRPVINLGFCGSGCMDAPVVELLAEIHAAAYVIDCGPNMIAEHLSQRTGPLVRRLREAHPDTPILLVENHGHPSPELLPGATAYIHAGQAALRAEYDRLVNDGVKHLYYLPGKDLIGEDGEGTGDGIHPNALGMFRYADAYTAALGAVLK